MIILAWLRGVLAHRPGRLIGSALGVALTVALLASLGSFITSSTASMTERAIKEVPVDWQIQLVPGTSVNQIKPALTGSTAYTNLEQVGYADTAGFSASSGSSTQTTGPGKVLGISDKYFDVYPGEYRQLLGSRQGVLVAQQTAANLHVTVGDTVTIFRVGLPQTSVKVDGIVDLPNADSLFQAVGVPAGASPQAPPDNVLLLPSNQWHRIFDQQAVVRPDSIRTQMHVRIAHNLPSDPTAAYTAVTHRANNLEARIAGSGVVGDNLGARLGGAREDALYAKVLFLFLGLPGAILAIVLTLNLASSGSKRRLQEQALLRIRGASIKQVLELETAEAVLAGSAGVVLGGLLAYGAHQWIAGGFPFIWRNSALWIGITALIGLLLAMAAGIYPAWVQARQSTVAAARVSVGKASKTLSEGLYLDIILLVIAAVVFWQTASAGYQLVLTPEGVADTSVHYEAFIAPLCLWIGGVLFFRRLWNMLLNRKRGWLNALLSPIAGRLSGVVAASLSRQRLIIARGMLLVALAISFAVSTSIFNTTYSAQSQVDAELTNGSDVTVSGPPFADAGGRLTAFKSLPGVVAAQPMQHRFAYVGNDLQDIYGIDPAHIGEVTSMSNAYFASGNAQQTLADLSNHADGVLVSEETVRDFQLTPGDQLNLRLQNARDHKYHIVPFQFIGIVREFPTAPKDSFLVANASYIAAKTASNAHETALLRTDSSPAYIAGLVRKMISPVTGLRVTDINTVQRTISSSLTAVDVRGLTGLELAFALLLAAGATGLVLAMGLSERRRSYAILSALGAKRRQIGAFLWSEGLLILVGGGLAGTILGVGIAQTLVKVLSGVFDPPPETLTIPWAYMAILALAATVSTIIAVLGAQRIASKQVAEELRGL